MAVYVSSSLFSSDGFDSQVDLLELSQEIDLAMKRHTHSSTNFGDSSGVGLQGCGGEEFPDENMHSWECGIEPGQETHFSSQGVVIRTSYVNMPARIH